MRRISGETAAAASPAALGSGASGRPSGAGVMRGRVEVLLELARHLPVQDRALVEQVIRRGASAAEVARLRGERPRATQKRLRSLFQRMRSREYRLLAEREALVPENVRAAARAVIFERRTLRETARLTHQSLHDVRRHMLAVRTLARL